MNNQVVSLLQTLVGFDTTSSHSNLPLIAFIRDYLWGFGVDCHLFYDEERRKASLLARIGPEIEGGIMLSGHTDVVPVEGQSWHFPPFRLTGQDGRCYGRGTADMKGFIACVLAAVPAFCAQSLRVPLWLAFSYDEEVGCLGVRGLIAHLRTLKVRPACCVVGEPTLMRPVYGHKGKIAVRCEVHGLACHSAYAPQGVNAIDVAARLITYLIKQAERLREQQDARFDPPFTTLQVGTIRGGSVLNIVPQHCEFAFEIRTLPGVDARAIVKEIQHYASRELLPAMQQVSARCAITFTETGHYPGLLTATPSGFADNLVHWCEEAHFSTVAFGTEGGLFDSAGIATLICGPGSIEQGHKPDEYISHQQLQKCSVMLERLRQWMSDPCTRPPA